MSRQGVVQENLARTQAANPPTVIATPRLPVLNVLKSDHRP